jgi:DNA-directed RNA polymerase subunit beta'
MEELIYNETITKKEIKNIVNWFINNYGTIKTTKLIDKLKNIGFQCATESGISLGINDLKIPESKEILLEHTEKKIKKFENSLKKGEKDEAQLSDKYVELWNQTNEIMKEEILNNIREIDLLNPVYMILVSGARGNISQIKQLVGIRGLMVDSQGTIINTAIKNNLKEGLSTIEYFISCYGARKGLIDTSLKTANTGYLTRKLVYATQNQIILQSNCNTKKLDIIITNKKNYKETIKKIIGRTLGKNIVIKNVNIAIKGQDICNYIAKKLIKIKKFYIRSPLTCNLNNGLCQLCYGWDLARNKLVELGENVGIIAAQSIGEPGTQLTMRTFHTGGIFSSQSAKTILSKYNGKIFYNAKEGVKIIKTKYKEKLFLTLKEKNLIITKNKKIKTIIKLPKYSLIFFKNKKNVRRKQVIAEITNWNQMSEKKRNIKESKDKGTKEIKTKISGKIFLENFNKTNSKNEKLWVINLNIHNYNKINNNIKFKKTHKLQNLISKKFINYKRIDNQSHKNFKSKIVVKMKKINNLSLFNGKNLTGQKKTKLNYNINKIIKEKNQIIINKKHTTKLMIVKEILKSGKFLLKRFETGKNKLINYSFIIIETREKYVKIIKSNATMLPKNYPTEIKNKTFIKKGETILVVNYMNKRSSDIIQGLPKIEEIFETKKKINVGKNAIQEKLEKKYKEFKKIYNHKTAVRKSNFIIQKYLVNKIQSVYISQNINISNKHVEIVIKQMTSKVMIKKGGGSNFIKGEIIELNKIERINKKLIKKATYTPIIIGITKLTKLNTSFLTAACFQETNKILTNAAIEGKIDWLYGLKENIIMGNIIPSGTGYKRSK